METFPELTSSSKREVVAAEEAVTDRDGERTRRLYDAVAPLYAFSSKMFHSRAHSAALAVAGLESGASVLEVATGSGEMLTKLVRANPKGRTIGVDFSPKMAALSQLTARAQCPSADVHCQAADGRNLPFPTASFDVVFCCFLFELLHEDDVPKSLVELTRVLRPGGRLVTTLVGQNKSSFNALYRMCTKFAPAFWGQQRGGKVAEWLLEHGYSIDSDHHVGQLYYSSRILAARRPV